MKKGYYCPACGNLEAIKLAITTAKGKNLAVLFAPQRLIHRPDALMCCLECRHVANADSFRNKKNSSGG